MSSKEGSEDHRPKGSISLRRQPSQGSVGLHYEPSTTTTRQHESNHRQEAHASSIATSSSRAIRPVEVIETNKEDSMVTVAVRGHVQESLLEALSSLVTHEVKDVRTEGDTIVLVLNIPDKNESKKSIQYLEQELQVALEVTSRKQKDDNHDDDGDVKEAPTAPASGRLKEPSSSVSTIATLPASTDKTSSSAKELRLARSKTRQGLQPLPPNNDDTSKLDQMGRPALEHAASLRDNDISSLQDRGISRRGHRPHSMPGAFYVGDVDPGGEVQWASTAGSIAEVENEETAAVSDPTRDGDEDNATIRAFKVDEVAHEEDVRQRILDEAVEADVVDHEAAMKRKRCRAVVFSVLAVAVLAIAIGVSVTQSQQEPTVVLATEVPTMSPSGRPTQTPRPTLERVVNRGTLLCGAGDNVPGLHEFKKERNSIEGFTVDLCRAIATVVLGNASRTEIVPLATIDRFEALYYGEVDLLARKDTHTMAREVAEATTEESFSFSSPFLYSGLVFKGVPAFVECAETLDSYFGNCRQLRICVDKGTSLEAIVETLFPPSFVSKTESLIAAFLNGTCNTVATEPVASQEGAFRAAGYDGAFSSGTLLFSNEPLAMVTRRDDPEWSDIVDAVLNALWAAEAQGVTQTSAASLVLPSAAESTQRAFANAVAAVGNYGEMFFRHLDGIIPRSGLNTLNLQGSTGLLYVMPFGSLERTGPAPVRDGVLKSILERGHLRCGLPSNWNDLDVNFCLIVSTALFAASNESTVPTRVILSPDEQLSALESGEIDVLAAGMPSLLEDDVLEPTSLIGFSFSSPYFYGSPADLNDSSTRCLVTRQDDSQWSTFVDWCLIATIFAEEKTIGRNMSVQMPVVNLFGRRFVQMFRDIVASNGNYDDIYSRALGETIPRAGRNLLNTNPHGPQQYPFTLFP